MTLTVKVHATTANDEPLYRRRSEDKWLVTPEEGRAIEDQVAAALPLVRHGGEAESRILSLYLDHEGGGLAKRAHASPDDCVKLRVRGYLSPQGTTDAFVFEIKHRVAGTTSKCRVGVNPASLARLCTGDFTALDPTLLSDSQWALLAGRPLRPSVFVTYTRRVYQGDENLRVTFDRDVSWHEAPDEMQTAMELASLGRLPPPRGALGRVVVEVKQAHGETPAFVHESLDEQARSLTFSKFVAALGQDSTARHFVTREA